ncbi:Extracellular fibrinogen-binding protein [Staphylococcus aureus]|uniref:Extracellular fibrinogen-binding protein n=1 Tax=Staphylococcus aureus TaxID=1280 RepID=A0A380EI12_STAAU|nr:Extracellular fibrinogen-binding protein [Staphylococcus aureus]
MKKNFIGKSILSIAAISLTVSTFAGESHAQTKTLKLLKNMISIKQTLKNK